MWSSTHPYIFHPLPPLLSKKKSEESNMKFSQLVNLLPNFQNHVSAPRHEKLQNMDAAFKPHIFYLQLKPNQDFKMLPELFCYKYGPTIPHKVSVRDPVGNILYMKVTRWKEEVYVCDGWNYLVHFYVAYGGAFIRMSYAGLGNFDIQVFNSNDEQIVYPKMHNNMSFPPNPSSSKIVVEGHGHSILKPINPSKFVLTTHKTIDFEEAIGVKLKLLKSFCDYVLTKRDGEITIVDEYFKPWHCHLTHEVPDPLSCWVTVGWAAFSSAKKLHHGQTIKLGAMTENSTVLYYIPS